MGAAGTPFLSGSVALQGRKLHAKYTQKSSQMSFLERVGIEMGDAKLEKQEEACEILCSLKCWLPVRGRAVACDSSWAAATRSLELRSLRFLSSTSGYSEGVEKDMRVVGMGAWHDRRNWEALQGQRKVCHCITMYERLFKVAPGRPLGADSSFAA